MGKRLSENLSSLYIGAANKLKPKCSRRKIIAYVESYDDISFWRTLLGEYENETRYFEVMLPSKTTLAKGKKSVLMNELGPQRHCKRTEKETRPSISEMSLLKRKGIQRLHPTVKKE